MYESRKKVQSDESIKRHDYMIKKVKNLVHIFDKNRVYAESSINE